MSLGMPTGQNSGKGRPNTALEPTWLLVRGKVSPSRAAQRESLGP